MKIRRRSALAALLLAAPLMRLRPALAQASGAVPMAAWPHSFTVNGAAIVIYEPQAIDWQNRTTLHARAALSIQQAGAPAPIVGTIEFTGTTEVDLDNDMVTFSSPKLISSSFPSLDTTRAYALQQRIGTFLGTMPAKEIPLNTILLSLNEKPAEAPINNTPPQIFYSGQAASLVVFDGEPTLAPIGTTGLSYAVNTNWEVLFDAGAGGTWYLLNNGSWLIAPAYTGPYQPAGPLPASFSTIPNDATFGPIRKQVPGKPLSAGSVPVIFVSTKPAEIIVTEGPPALQPVPGTALSTVTNTGATLFRYKTNGLFYYLTSGRWFSAPSLYGPWTFASPNLPPDFSLLPPGGALGNILPAVPGTAQAQAAVLKAQIPVRATLPKQTTKLTVTYVGAPRFSPIPGTSLTYAVNTTYQVIATGGVYYCCYQGAWFVARGPSGPWALAISVPPAIYTIPPSSPVYNVTYVQVYSSTPTAVTYGYTAGYMMGFVTAGVLVYGTGYYYPPVVVYGAVPAYLPYPYSYGGNVYYNSANGVWARGGTVYGPYGTAATAGRAYNSTTGTYARGGAVYGPNGGAGAWSTYNPSTGRYSQGSASWSSTGGTAHASFENPRYGTSGSTTQNANAYGRWGSSTVSGPNGTVNTASASNSRGTAGAFNASNGAQGAAVHTTSGHNAGAVKTSSGNVYAGKDGNAYKKTSSGWSQYNNGSWQQMQKPTSSGTYNQLNRDQQARTYGGGGYARQGGGGYARQGGGGARWQRR